MDHGIGGKREGGRSGEGEGSCEQIILESARISSEDPKSQKIGLIKYLIKNGHWSPFEMASMCVEIITTRDISRQFLRHRSFSFQEFSQRYQSIELLQQKPYLREARLQDLKNRQNSIEIDDDALKKEWKEMQEEVWKRSFELYKKALGMGIAREQARSLLPEGLTMTKFRMAGNIRSWIHYCQLRSGNGTQKEHAEIAKMIQGIMKERMPNIAEALGW